ncbi:MAG: hypothetical protein MJY58_04515 [Bacteroidaceae bacterium]|nr:hypothetical protein [Bacteroidaceae bacterium]
MYYIKLLLSIIGKRYPEFVVRLRYLLRFHTTIDLDNPKTLNEKIQFLSLRTDTDNWTRLADKYLVRDYISECGYSDILVPLFGKWDNVSDIDFETLPEQFVIKTNNSSGECITIYDKSSTDVRSVRRHLRKFLKHPYGLLEGNLHYSRIKPLIIAEKLLRNDPVSALYSKTPIDYKIWCFNGKAYYVWACTDRIRHKAKVMTYDTEWNAHPEFSVFNSQYSRGPILPKPKRLDVMLEIAQKLSEPFPVVRIDMYNFDGTIYFGEMTFTSLGGYMDFYTADFLKYTGSLIKLPQASGK